MMLTDEHGLPVSLHIESASPSEVKLIEPLVDRAIIPLPKNAHLLYDKAADSESLRWFLREIQCVRLISPYRKRRNETAARRLNKRDRNYYRKRYRVERSFAWLKNLRRLQVRHEYNPQNYKAFWIVGILFTMLKKL